MANIKNEEHWSAIEDLEAFQDADNEKPRDWLYKFQETTSKHLSALALIQLEALIRNVYEAGVEKGHEDETKG